MRSEMVICIIRARVHLPECHSLKEKRHYVRSITDGARARFPFSVAEVGDLDVWQNAEFGFTAVSNNRTHLQRLNEKLRSWLQQKTNDLILSYISDYMYYTGEEDFLEERLKV